MPGRPDKIDEGSGVLEAEAQVEAIMKDLKVRISAVADLCSEDKLPDMPDYKALQNDNDLYFRTNLTFLDIYDKIANVKMRISLVRDSLEELQYARFIGANAEFVGRFRNSIKRHIEFLSRSRFDMGDIQKIVGYRLDLLRSISYMVGE